MRIGAAIAVLACARSASADLAKAEVEKVVCVSLASAIVPFDNRRTARRRRKWFALERKDRGY